MPISKSTQDKLAALMEGAYAVPYAFPCHTSRVVDFIIRPQDVPVSKHTVQCFCGQVWKVSVCVTTRPNNTPLHSFCWVPA